MALERVKRWLSREHRTLRREVIDAFREHGFNVKGRDLLGYNKDELLKIKDMLAELKEKHGMSLWEFVGKQTSHGFAPFAWDREALVRNRLSNGLFMRFLEEGIRELARQEAEKITQISPDIAKIREIDYNGRKIRLTEDDLAAFLHENGIKHAKYIKAEVLERILTMRRTEKDEKLREATEIVNLAKKHGVKGVRVQNIRIPIEEIERAVKSGNIYAYWDAIKALEKAIQKSTKVRKRVRVKDVGRFISIWMPKGRQPAPLTKKDIVNIVENARALVAELERAYRNIAAYDARYIGHANASEALLAALRENPEAVLRGMNEILNEALLGNPQARVRTYEIHGPESVFTLLDRRVGGVMKDFIEHIAKEAAKKPEAVIKKLKEEQAHLLGRQIGSVLLDMHANGQVRLRSVPLA